jgi:hypothetical protein
VEYVEKSGVLGGVLAALLKYNPSCQRIETDLQPNKMRFTIRCSEDASRSGRSDSCNL